MKMARETKAERLLREENERAMYAAERQATYLPRLMNVMQRAQAVNFELAARSDMTFALYDRDERDQDKYVLDLEYSNDANDAMETLEREVNWKEERNAEANRKYLVRQTALAKLTAEERELLNVS
jgi:hypothetical protein